MENKTKYLAIASLSLMCGLMLRSCLQRNKPVVGDPIGVGSILPSSDTLRIGVHGTVIEVQTPKGLEKRYVPEEGKAIVEVKKDGSQTITVKNKGFCMQPGFGVMVADKFRLGVDYEFAYFNRLGALVGVGFSGNPVAVGYIGVGYQLDQLHLTNTSLFVGYSTHKDIVVGVRMAL